MTGTLDLLEQRAHDPDLAPKDVSETLLELTGQALLRRDSALFAPNFNLPQHLTTQHGRSLVRTRTELVDTFHALCDHFKAIRLTELVRICEVAKAVSPTKIHATHIAHMLSNGTWIKAPYPAFSVIEYTTGRWRVSSSEYAIATNTSHARALHKTGKLPLPSAPTSTGPRPHNQ